MKKEEKKSAEMPKVPVREMLAKIAAQYRGKDMFPEMTEQCRQFLRKVKGAKV